MVNRWKEYSEGRRTCLVCFSNAVSFSIAPVTFVWSLLASPPRRKIVVVYLCQLLSFRNLFVNLLGEVLVRLEDLAVRHGAVLEMKSLE
jgi:hypothetical protein